MSLPLAAPASPLPPLAPPAAGSEDSIRHTKHRKGFIRRLVGQVTKADGYIQSG